MPKFMLDLWSLECLKRTLALYSLTEQISFKCYSWGIFQLYINICFFEVFPLEKNIKFWKLLYVFLSSIHNSQQEESFHDSLDYLAREEALRTSNLIFGSSFTIYYCTSYGVVESIYVLDLGGCATMYVIEKENIQPHIETRFGKQLASPGPKE